MKETKKDKKKNQPEAESLEKKPQIKDNESPANNENAGQKDGFEAEPEKACSETEELQKKLAEINDRYVRLSAEFDNYRKRTLKEKTELIKSGGEDVIVNLLHVVDDFERAMLAMEKSEEIEPIRDGVKLIYSKFMEYLKSRGVKEIESIKLDFNTDVHEAITKIPAPEESMKGKIVDVVQKGYYMHDKVIRFAKVVVGE